MRRKKTIVFYRIRAQMREFCPYMSFALAPSLYLSPFYENGIYFVRMQMRLSCRSIPVFSSIIHVICKCVCVCDYAYNVLCNGLFVERCPYITLKVLDSCKSNYVAYEMTATIAIPLDGIANNHTVNSIRSLRFI